MTQKFEDTKLLQHPEVEKAYGLYLEYKNSGDEHKEYVADMTLKSATLISELGAQKNPHLVAAALAMPEFLNNTEDETVMQKFEKDFDALTLQYLVATSVMMHPMGISEVFPQLPRGDRQAAVTLLAAMQIDQLQEMAQQAAGMSPKDLKRALDDFEHGDPVMPSFKQMVGYTSLRKNEPQIMAAYDTQLKALRDVANGTKPAPSAPAPQAPTP